MFRIKTCFYSFLPSAEPRPCDGLNSAVVLLISWGRTWLLSELLTTESTRRGSVFAFICLRAVDVLTLQTQLNCWDWALTNQLPFSCGRSLLWTLCHMETQTFHLAWRAIFVQQDKKKKKIILLAELSRRGSYVTMEGWSTKKVNYVESIN